MRECKTCPCHPASVCCCGHCAKCACGKEWGHNDNACCLCGRPSRFIRADGAKMMMVCENC